MWGQTECLLQAPLLELHRIHVVPWAQCSLHKHDFKCNCFIVVEGMLVVEVLEGDFAFAHHTLTSGDFFIQPAGVYHQFRTREMPCLAYELYYVEQDPLARLMAEDIVRKNVGFVSRVFHE